MHDLNLLSRYVTEIEKLTPRQLEAADVNNDGEADIKDVVKLSQYLVGWTGVELMNLGDTADIKLGTASVGENGTAYIPVSIENSSGIAGFRFMLDYNSDEMEILEIIPNEKLLSGNFMTNLGQEGENGTVVTWYQESDITADGELFMLKVRCKDPANIPVSSVSITDFGNNMCDQSLNSVLGNYETGYVLNKGCVIVRNEQGIAELYSVDAYEGRSAVVIAAEYDEHGSMLQCETKPVTLYGGRQEVDFSKVTGNDARYFIWDSLESMKPVG